MISLTIISLSVLFFLVSFYFLTIYIYVKIKNKIEKKIQKEFDIKHEELMTAYLNELDSLYRVQNYLMAYHQHNKREEINKIYPLEKNMKKSSEAHYRAFGKNRDGWTR
jgi:hypothetical protein